MSGVQKTNEGTATIAANGRVDRRVGQRRDRHMMSRYEYPEDRMEFQRWRCAPGPCQRPYWYFDQLRGRLTIELRKADRVMCYDLTMLELEMSRMGWRWLVAQAVRQARHALTPNVELTGAARLYRAASRERSERG